MSRRSFATALWGASTRAIWFVASLSLQLSDAIWDHMMDAIKKVAEVVKKTFKLSI